MELILFLQHQNKFIEALPPTESLTILRNYNEELLEHLIFDRDYPLIFEERIVRILAKLGFRYYSHRTSDPGGVTNIQAYILTLSPGSEVRIMREFRMQASKSVIVISWWGYDESKYFENDYEVTEESIMLFVNHCASKEKTTT